MNSTIELSSYSLEELTEALRVMKSYRTSLRQIGARAKLEDPKHQVAPSFSIEYAPGFTIDIVQSFARSAVSEYFPEALFDDNVTFIENKKITGGIRIFYGDDMMDVSFEKFKNLLVHSA
jgi:hypothetical protein